MSNNLLLRVIHNISSLFETFNVSSSRIDLRKNFSSKRKLTFETLEPRELLSVTPYHIEETGTYHVNCALTEAGAQNTLCAYYVDGISGQIDGIAPDDPDYVNKAQERILGGLSYNSNDPSSGKMDLVFTDELVGKYLAFFAVSSHPDWQNNYFIFDAANENRSAHFAGSLRSGIDAGGFKLEDIPSDQEQDNDYNDLVLTTYFVPQGETSIGRKPNNPLPPINHDDSCCCCGPYTFQCCCDSDFGSFVILMYGDLFYENGGQNYVSCNDQFSVIQSDFRLPSVGALPERIVATLNFSGLDPITVYYDPSGFSNGDLVTFGIQADVSLLSSGRYDWTLDIESRFADEATSTITRTGTQDVVNWTDNQETGTATAWNLSAFDKVQITNNGVNWLRGNGNSIWFNLDDGVYTVESGSEAGSQLTNDNGIITITQKDGTEYHFNSSGFIVTIIDPAQNQTNYTYDSQQRLSKITPPNGHATTYSYDLLTGLLSSKADFKGRVTSYGYDNLGRLISVTLPDPDGDGDLLSPVTLYEYLDDTSLISRITDPIGNITDYTYDDNGSLIAVTSNNRTDTYVGYGAGVVTDLNVAGYDNDHPAVLQPYSDKLGKRTDANGNTVSYSTDNLGNIIYELYANGYEVNYVRDVNGNVIRQFERIPLFNGLYDTRVTEFSYDNNDNLIQRKNPDGQIESWTYDSTFNQVTSYVDQLGRMTIYEIDSATGLVLSVTSVVGDIDDTANGETDDVVTSYTYTSASVKMHDPPAGLISTITDPLGFVTQFTYTMCGHVSSITEAFGTSEAVTSYYEYDSYMRESAFIDPLGRRTEYFYDNLDNLIMEVLPSGQNESPQIYQYEYDAINRLTKTIDPNGAETIYAYDQFNNITSISFIDPENTQQTSPTLLLHNVYDLAGNLTFQYDSLGRYTEYTYDNLNQLIAAQSGSSTVSAVTDLQLEYDGLGRISAQTDAAGVVVTFTYDSMNRLLETRRLNDNAIVERRVYDAAGQLIEIYDAHDNKTQFVYDSLGRVIQTILPDPDDNGILTSPVYSQTYDKLGRITSETDPLGQVTYYEYNALGLLTRVVEPGDDPNNLPTTEYSYNNAGELIQVIFPDGKTVDYTYDLLGRVLTTTITGDMESITYENSYERFGRTVYETDPHGNIVAYVYDNLDQLIEVHTPNPDDSLLPLIYRYEYDTAGQLISEYDNLGNIKSYEYDYHGNLTKITLPDPDGAGNLESPVYVYQYDNAGRLTSEIDPLGNSTNYFYTGVGYLEIVEHVSATDSEIRFEEYEYDLLGNMITMYDSLGNDTLFYYDNLGRLIQKMLPVLENEGGFFSPVYSYSYDAAGQLVTETLPSGVSITYQYNSRGQIARAIESSSDYGYTKTVTTNYGYDILGQLISVTDGAGRTTNYEYDYLGRLVKTILPDPDGSHQLTSPIYETVYDALGNVIEEIDPLGNSTIYTYDSRNRLIATTDANDYTTTYEYNANDQLTALTDAANNTTTFTYDNLGRVIAETNELGDSCYYSYNGAGLLTEQVDRNGLVTLYSYNGFYENIGETWLDQNAQIVKELNFEYDSGGNLTVVNDNDASFVYQYDALSRLISSEVTLNGLLLPVLLSYSYDFSSRLARTKAKIGQEDDFENIYSYNAFDELTGITQTAPNNSTKNIQYTYNQASQRTRLKRYENSVYLVDTLYEYDDIGRLSQIAHLGSTQLFAYYNMEYDAASRITSINDATYNYDSTDQLIGADYDNQSDESYAYDETGNRINYTVGANNQILSDGIYNYAYDDEGNRISKTNIATGETTTYDWDHRNRLISVTINTGTTTTTVNYRYDYLNRLVERTVAQVDQETEPTSSSTPAQTTTEHFIHDGNQIVLQFADNELAQRNFWGSGIDELLAVDNVLDEETLW
ncbi:MAG: hypothetical protein LBH59_06000, partial [Planctomycetaceae bacterium]|nr:hypothetical protein [Planctomycetaceae bacterium]